MRPLTLFAVRPGDRATFAHPVPKLELFEVVKKLRSCPDSALISGSSSDTSDTMANMFACSFIFRKKSYDEEFHRLDASIDAYAQSLDGYLGVDRWFSEDGKAQNSIYYWRDMDAVSVFARFPDHLEAKEKHAQWYEGYQIVISEVTASYGDGNIPHITSGPAAQ